MARPPPPRRLTARGGQRQPQQRGRQRGEEARRVRRVRRGVQPGDRLAGLGPQAAAQDWGEGGQYSLGRGDELALGRGDEGAVAAGHTPLCDQCVIGR